MDHQSTRRDLLRVGGTLVFVTATASACDLLSTNPSRSGQSGRGAGGGPKPKEAPMLADLVKRGAIDPVEKRLPPKPVIVQPNDRPGVYGGEWRLNTVASGYGTGATQYQIAGYENLVRWDPTFTKIIPNIADSYEISADSTTYTFHLHKGIRWSDGHPFTAADMVFAVQDVIMNTELSPIPQFGEMSAEQLDDYTVRLTFAEPNGVLIQNIVTRTGLVFTDNPAHYLKQFHKKYNPNVNALVEKEKLDDWLALFNLKGGDYSFGSNVDKPTLYPWVLKSVSNSQIVVERNPYYWKVDPDGSQLPYLDRIVWTVVTNEETTLLKTANGEVDFSYGDPKNKPVLARGRSQGDYRFFDAVPGHTSDVCIYPNLAHKNPVLRKIFQNKDFRIGLSYAINRQEIIDAVFQRQGEPWQIAPRKESSYYDREMAEQYLEYDPDRANEYLDRAFPDKDPDGRRLGPDGKPITFNIDVHGGITEWVDTIDLVVRYWRKVGVNARLNNISPELAVTRGEANQHDMAVWSGEGGLDAVILINPYNYLPILSPYSFFGVPWVAWYDSDGKEGENPPTPVRRQLQLYDEALATSDTQRQHDLMTEILHIAKEEFFGIGISAPTSSYGIVSNRTQNWAKQMTTGTVWVYMDPAPSNPCQYFVEER
ncbi:ABC transporter substrate-binding protein [Actinopolymorpha pittospori]|uniref:Peptide/nickel transport system substrate-binding protein n=1 Tax=Actinopolymorpha pittospori TaxID=648752 RepID=A0A927N4X4_9ACTN|nr:ABC transporter substrate-binding protein [Actinopolymorpha pittospori]MBE1608605.1 peptide/nickel transport system substrate-binding protein [Actinopolymorpha pittospori]